MKTILRSEVENTQTGETGSMEPWGFTVGYRLEELRCQVECHILTYFNVIFFTFFYKKLFSSFQKEDRNTLSCHKSGIWFIFLFHLYYLLNLDNTFMCC